MQPKGPARIAMPDKPGIRHVVDRYQNQQKEPSVEWKSTCFELATLPSPRTPSSCSSITACGSRAVAKPSRPFSCN